MRYEANAFKVSFIFPKRYPDGRPIATSVWNAMSTELWELESDFTEISVSGEWRSEEDAESRMYFVTVSEIDRVEALQQFVTRWRQPFQQRAMYFDYHPVRFELLDETANIRGWEGQHDGAESGDRRNF